MILKLRSIALTTLLIILTTQNAEAQKIVRSFKGRVIDSATSLPIPDVTVSIYRASDTSLINFGFTTPNGNFTINVNNQDSLIITFSILNYDEVTKKDALMDDNWDFTNYGDIKLSKASVVFKATVRSSAIRMRGDTMEINASRFKVLPGSDVAQLFKKIPGFEVNVKGEIKVGGVAVDKIMVDGSDFFGNNPGMVSKNLQADMIETVQVFEAKNEDGTPLDESKKIINLKLKKNKRNGLFGDVLAGYGTTNRYESGIRLNNFKNDRKLSFILNSNNINGTGFDFGFDNWHGAQTENRNGSGNDFSWTNYYNNDNGEGNINNKLNGGFSYFNEFSKKRKLSMSILFDRNKYNSINTSSSLNALQDTIKRLNSDSSNIDGLAKGVKISIDYTKRIDSTGRFEMGINTKNYNNYTDVSNFSLIKYNNQLVNEGLSNTSAINLQNTLGVNGFYSRSLRKNKKYSYSLSTKYDIDNNNNNLFQFTKNFSDTFNFQRTNLINRSEWLSKLTLTAPLAKNLSFNIASDYFLQNNRNKQSTINAVDSLKSSFEQEYKNKVDSLTLNYNNSISQTSVKPYLSFYNKKVYAALAYTIMNVDVSNKNLTQNLSISRNYLKTLPSLYLGFYNSASSFSINANKSIVYPNASDLMPVLNLNNTWQRSVGNTNLKPQEKYSLNIHSYIKKIKYLKYFYFNGSAAFSDNYKISVNKINNEGVVVQMPINASGHQEFDISQSLGKKLSNTISLNNRLSYDYLQNPIFMNENKGYNSTNNYGLFPLLSYSKTDSFELSLGSNFNWQRSTNTINENLNYKQYTQSFEVNVRGVLKWGTELSTSIDINDQRNVPNIGKVIPVWNAYIQQPLGKKSNYNIKLSAYDILKQNVNISRSSYNGYVYTNKSNQLQQYFMLSLVYKIKKMGGGDDDFNYVY